GNARKAAIGRVIERSPFGLEWPARHARPHALCCARARGRNPQGGTRNQCGTGANEMATIHWLLTTPPPRSRKPPLLPRPYCHKFLTRRQGSLLGHRGEPHPCRAGPAGSKCAAWKSPSSLPGLSVRELPEFEADGLLLAVANEVQIHGFVWSQRGDAARQIARVLDLDAIHARDDVAWLQAGRRRRTSGLRLCHKRAGSRFQSEAIGDLFG